MKIFGRQVSHCWSSNVAFPNSIEKTFLMFVVNSFMKKTVMVAAMMMVIFAAGAQDKAYWVVEGNNTTNDKSIVRIYDEANQLLSETTLDRNVDISKRRERKKLDQLVAATRRDASTVAVARKKYNKLDDEKPHPIILD